MKKEYDFSAVLRQFEWGGAVKDVSRYGEGHINDTFLVRCDGNGGERKYILQRINSDLFRDVDALMRNIVLVTEFNRARVQARGGDPDREGLTVVRTKDGNPYYRDADGGCWRVYIFIEGATSYQTVQKPADFQAAAVAFGNFANLLAEFDAAQLVEILPDFHHTKKRYEAFLRAVEADVCGRAASVQKEIDWVKAHRDLCGKIVDKMQSGEIPLRVTHNDTKYNNIMIDDVTGKAIAVIDLDTVMPGSLCYDFGDSIRFGCNPAAEDEPDLKKVEFRIDLFEAFAEGYLSAVG